MESESTLLDVSSLTGNMNLSQVRHASNKSRKLIVNPSISINIVLMEVDANILMILEIDLILNEVTITKT